ncbi:MAG TPA: hypothetical protein VE988_02860, partial [Gemmataceae bacterium]|nr:hypothetical protein [Gemmataceae bacterium]
LRQFVMNGNCLDVRPEIRAEWREEYPDDPFWYRAVIPVPTLKEGLFVEVRLYDCDPEEPWVEIVNAHPQRS